MEVHMILKNSGDSQALDNNHNFGNCYSDVLSLNSLSDQLLLEETKSLVSEEGRITRDVISHLEEIERRKLYLKRGYPSLFEMCTKELNYSESSAGRRIAAMRLIKTLPEAKEKLEQGKVNLSTLTQLNTFIRREEKTSSTLIAMPRKQELLKLIENKSQRQTESA